MRWLIDDLKYALQQLKRAETWIFLGVLTGFTILGVAVAQVAFQTDSILRFLRLTVTACREMTNGPIIFMFCGGIFFILAVSTTFGEIQRYFFLRDRRNGDKMAKQALRSGFFWGAFACLIAVGAITFFHYNCR